MISKDDVKYVADLARIHLRDEEIEHLTTDLEKILQHIKKLDTLDVGEVQPTSHVYPLKLVQRVEQVRASANSQPETHSPR